uniref:G-protein coupled receptors family 1 profile domain-containing protein n=1 Tax=Ciona savignyi TaxID=51511 RepID=H2YGR3_CIOSA
CYNQTQKCNGILDCIDGSDERNCSCHAGTLPCDCQLTEAGCSVLDFQCYSPSMKCDAKLNCEDGTDENNCTYAYTCDCNHSVDGCSDQSLGFYTELQKCNGHDDCGDQSDEKNCKCKANELHCPCNNTSNSSVDDLLRNKLAYCDGKEKLQGFGDLSNICRHGFDEVNCTTQFYCKNGHFISIPKADMCDGEINCDDGSDEAKSLCQFTRFYCRNGKPLSVPVNTVENGIKDCFDGSDECPINSNKSSIFSSPREMIANQFFRILFWFMGIIAIVGNSIVCTGSVIKLIKGNNPVALVNHLFIINISFSDFLMGVYLIAISIKGLTFSGSYCYHDLEWRSSSLCSFLGALVVTSIEASAVTMTLMTTFRLLSVWDPIRMQHVSWKPFCFSLVIVWVIAIFLGTIPLFAETEYFLSSIWFPNYFYSRQIMRKADVIQLIQRI